MNRKQLVDSVYESFRAEGQKISKKQIAAILVRSCDIIVERTSAGEDVGIPGFASFKTGVIGPRRIYVPQPDGETKTVQAQARYTVALKPSANWRTQLLRGYERAAAQLREQQEAHSV